MGAHFNQRRWAAPAVGLVAFVVYVAAPQRVQSDSIWTVPTALSLTQRGDLNLDEYRPACERLQHGCSELHGHLVSDFPVAPALFAAVGVGVFDGLLRMIRPLLVMSPAGAHQVTRWETHRDALGDIDPGFFDVTENLVASACVAAAVALFFVAARRRFAQEPTWLPLAATATLALGTGAFSTASRVLWQHGPAMLCVSGALVLLTTPGPASRRQRFALGAVLAAGWVCRPTMSLFAAAVLVMLLWTRPRELPFVLLGGALVVAAFVGLNLATLGQPLPPYFVAARLDPFGAHVPEALAGNLVSPSRGLLLFTPLTLFVPLGIATALRQQREARALPLALAAWLGLHWLAVSTFPHWWGGHSLGPRFWAETSPALVWLAALALTQHPSRARVLALATVALVGVAVHTRGSMSLKPWRWNDTPVNVDQAPERLWDWRDPQFLR